MHHQPVYSAPSNNGHGSSPHLQARWAPLFDQYGVDLVLNGHDHKYERTVPLRGGLGAQTGTVYVVTGAAGSPLYDAEFAPWTVATRSAAHFVVLRVRPGALRVTAHADDGLVFDAFERAR
jgi:hypothetical protein